MILSHSAVQLRNCVIFELNMLPAARPSSAGAGAVHVHSSTSGLIHSDKRGAWGCKDLRVGRDREGVAYALSSKFLIPLLTTRAAAFGGTAVSRPGRSPRK